MRVVLLILALGVLGSCGHVATCETEGLKQRLDHFDECIDPNTNQLYAAPGHRQVN